MLEIVLGVDNLVFISIAVSKLPPEQRPRARKVGLALACLTRIGLLLSLAFLASMKTNLFSLFGQNFSVRDIVLIAGGLFLLVKGTMEIHDSVEGRGEDEDIDTKPSAVFGYVIAQIAIIDIVFSLDSVITAVGMVGDIAIMIIAVVASVGVMMFAAKPIGEFVDDNPTIKILALSFLTVVGILLIAEGFGQHVPKGYVYFGMAFSLAVELLNIRMRRNQQKLRLHKHMPGGGD